MGNFKKRQRGMASDGLRQWLIVPAAVAGMLVVANIPSLPAAEADALPQDGRFPHPRAPKIDREAWLRQRAAWLERARNAGVHKPDGMDAAAANAGDQGLRTAVQRFLWAMVYFAAAYGM